MTIAEFKKTFGIVGKSKSIKDLVDIAMQVAQSDISVLIYGESGTGKEVFANAIHKFSRRKDARLVSVNCGAIPEGLLESELFGHKKGSFTGALDDRRGYFEIADNGTLFLDEIAEMPLTTQVKLLRVLETKEFMRIGSETVTKVDVRIIAATNKDLQHEVYAKKFRNDLYFRLKAVTLTIPPLRERREDIPILIEHFIESYEKRNNVHNISLTQDALDKLITYKWPGNIRELKNTIESSLALSNNSKITAQILSALITDKTGESFERNLPIHLQKTSEELDREMIYRALIEIKKDLIELKSMASKIKEEENVTDIKNVHVNEVVPMENLEREAIKNAILYTKGNKRKAAKLLNISERTLYRKLKDYDLHL
ncbi:MAG: sigma-54 dependent transcriptional regulator [Ignavibacteria bacterium]|jgi:DNA-binding NtrC family response regulator